MNEYELTYILKVGIDSEESKKVTERLDKLMEKHAGTILREQELGEKALAYRIQKEGRGTYVRRYFLGSGDLVDAIEQQLRITSNVLRFLTVREDRDVDPEQKKKEHAAAALKVKQAKEAAEQEPSGSSAEAATA